MASSPKLPSAVQRTLDRGLADASAAGIQNLPPTEASAAAMQTAQQVPDPQIQGQQTPSTSPTGGQAPAEPSAPASVTPIDWEQRYKAMKGRYDAEIPRMKEQLEEAQLTIQQLQALSQTQQLPAPAESVPPVETPPARWYGDEDLENFGQDFFDLVDKRVAPIEQRFQTEMQQLVTENNQLRQQLDQLGQGVQKIEKQPLLSALDQKMPDWRQLNRDPEFLRWARETMVSHLDPRPMLDALRDSFAQGRVEIVAEIFKAYPGAQGDGMPPVEAAQPSSQPVPVPGSQPPVQPPQVPATTVQPAMTLQSLSGPGTPQESSADVLQPAVGRVWTDAMISQFYDGVRRGDVSPQDAQRLEADLQQAISPAGRQAGRYRPR